MASRSVAVTNVPTKSFVKIEAIKPEKIGFECEFVEKPPSHVQSECPVCLLVLREPYQVTCCGKSFCRACIGRIKSEHKPCPTCNEESIQYFPNKGLQQPLYQFKVRCSNQKEGCEWTGELGELDNHLNLVPQTDKQLEGCAYAKIECRYRFAGCYITLPRREMSSHIKESAEHHLTLLEAKYHTVCRQMTMDRNNIHSKFPTPPKTFTMKKYNYHSQELKEWFSSPFYTSLRGYKMFLRVDCGMQRPLSIQIGIIKGEFDDNLQWYGEFKPEVGIEVVSQVTWQRNKSVVLSVDYMIKPDAETINSHTRCYGTDASKSLIQPKDMEMFIKNDSVQFRITFARQKIVNHRY